MRFHEFVVATLDGKVDTEKKVIRDVALLGRVSQNNRKYSPDALTDAVRVFEGAKVFLNHSEDGKPHDVRNFVGRVTGLYHDPQTDRVRAKELTITNDAHWPLIEAIASRDPAAAGFSIDADGVVRNGEVTKINRGFSVDFVSSPATVRGLFESEATMDWAALTLDAIQQNRPDLIAALTAKAAEAEQAKAAGQIEAAQKEAVAAKAELTAVKEAATKATRARLAEQVKAAGVPDDAAEVLMEGLLTKPDDEQRKVLESFGKGRPRSAPYGAGNGGALTLDEVSAAMKE